MKYEIDTVLAGARAERLDQRAIIRDALEGHLREQAERADVSAARRTTLTRELRQLSDMVEEGMPPFDRPLVFDDGGELNARIRSALKGLPSKTDQRRLERDIAEARTHLAAAELDRESYLESYLQAAQAAGETHISTNALKDAGISPRETMDLVARGQQVRFGTHA